MIRSNEIVFRVESFLYNIYNKCLYLTYNNVPSKSCYWTDVNILFKIPLDHFQGLVLFLQNSVNSELCKLPDEVQDDLGKMLTLLLCEAAT